MAMAIKMKREELKEKKNINKHSRFDKNSDDEDDEYYEKSSSNSSFSSDSNWFIMFISFNKVPYYINSH